MSPLRVGPRPLAARLAYTTKQRPHVRMARRLWLGGETPEAAQWAGRPAHTRTSGQLVVVVGHAAVLCGDVVLWSGYNGSRRAASTQASHACHVVHTGMGRILQCAVVRGAVRRLSHQGALSCHNKFTDSATARGARASSCAARTCLRLFQAWLVSGHVGLILYIVEGRSFSRIALRVFHGCVGGGE